MSYPEPRYKAMHGEINARLRLAHDPPELDLGRVQASYLATGASTEGKFGLYRWDMVAGSPGGADPHFHRSIAESFFVLSGTVRLFDGAQWVDASAGDFLYVPEGGIHGFRNESGEAASMLILFAPGALREAYFEALPELGQMSPERKVEFFIRHDTYWT